MALRGVLLRLLQSVTIWLGLPERDMGEVRGMQTSQVRTAVLVDDQPVWLDALESILASAGISVVGKTVSAEEAIALLAETNAVLLVADLRLHAEFSGSDLIREAIARYPGLHAVIVSGYDDDLSIEEALASGAEAFVSKTAFADEIAVAVRQVFDRSFFLAPNAGMRRNGHGAHRPGGLTRREGDILSLVAEGHSNSQVARMLWVTEQTVKFHLRNIYRKLGVANRTEAAHWAHTHQVEEDDGRDSVAVPTG
jgi:DNA-binding NarL/FixJ family response regulator